MCPEKEILSAFFDGEVPSPWKEKIAAHAAECADCSRALDAYSALRQAFLEDAGNTAPAAASADFRERLRTAARTERKMSVWKRKVSFSFAAAAAAAAFILGGSFGFTVLARSGGDSRTASDKVKPLDVTVKVKDVKQLLEILNNQKTIREVTIQLPEAKQFEIRSEPIFLKDAEFSGGSR